MLIEENAHTIEPSTSRGERVMNNNQNSLHKQNPDTSVPTRHDLKSTHSLNGESTILQKYEEDGNVPEYVPLALGTK